MFLQAFAAREYFLIYFWVKLSCTQGEFRVFSQHFGNMTRTLELGIFASFYTKLGKNTPYNKNKNIKYFVYPTSYSSLTHKQILKSDLQSDLPFVVGAQKNRLIKMVLLSTHNICFA